MADPKTPKTPKTRLELLNEQMAEHQLTILEDQVGKIQSNKATAIRNRADQERSNRIATEAERQDQESCLHRKGGRGIEARLSGSDAEHSVIKHTEPWGETYVKCGRCGKEVRDPMFMARKKDPKALSKLKAKDPKKYQVVIAQIREWKKWMNLPTDNSPSGSTVFLLQRPDEMQDMSEIDAELEDAA